MNSREFIYISRSFLTNELILFAAFFVNLDDSFYFDTDNLILFLQ